MNCHSLRTFNDIKIRHLEVLQSFDLPKVPIPIGEQEGEVTLLQAECNGHVAEEMAGKSNRFTLECNSTMDSRKIARHPRELLDQLVDCCGFQAWTVRHWPAELNDHFGVRWYRPLRLVARS